MGHTSPERCAGPSSANHTGQAKSDDTDAQADAQPVAAWGARRRSAARSKSSATTTSTTMLTTTISAVIAEQLGGEEELREDEQAEEDTRPHRAVALADQDLVEHDEDQRATA